jgi:limonene-1,2-epoxide hydrolase
MLNRREIMLTGAAALSVTACGGLTAMNAEQAKMTEQDQRNEKLVRDFCRDWSLRDVDALLPYLAEDLLYQIAPGQPLITSRDQFAKQMGPFLKKLDSVRWDILRSCSVAPLVLNERIDYFNAPPGGLSMEFHIAGHFLIVNGVIKEWKDWPVPGTKQKVGNSIREA